MGVTQLGNSIQAVRGFTADARVAANDAAIASGQAFLIGELEKRDPRLLEPLAAVTYPRDMPIKPGGGPAEFTSQYFVDYATSGNGANGIIRNQSTDIPVMQVNTTKDIWEVFAWASILKVPFLDEQKMQQVGRSLNQMLDDGIRLNHNKTLDSIVYQGIPDQNIYGLVNNTSVTAGSAAQAGSTSPTGNATSTKWFDKTPDSILNDVNSVLVSTWENSEYDLTGMANHILIPPAQYAYLQQPVTSAGSQSILNYLLDNNIGQNQGVDLFIGPSRWCTGAGASGTDRMVAYRRDENKINMDLNMPLSRVGTEVSISQMAYLTAYQSYFSQVKFLYYQTVQYVDGI